MDNNNDPALRPKDWDSYIGQANLKRVVDVAIEAALKESRAMRHLLLQGPPGCGKTTMAQIIAARLGDPLVMFTRPPTSTQFLDELMGWGSNPDFRGSGVCFVDEAHRLSNAMQSDLLQLLEDKFLETKDGRWEFPHITVILATTEREKLLRPLIERCVEPTFEPYTDEEMARIVLGMAGRANATISEDEAVELGRAAGGVPRRARHFVNTWRELELYSKFALVEEVLDLCEAEADGLTSRHLTLLETIDSSGGQVGLEGLAMRLRLHPSEVRELERLLLERRLMGVGNGGRYLTPTGRARLAGDRPQIARRARAV